MTAALRQMKAVVSINDETLTEDTDPEFEFRYVDISSVGQGMLVREPERLAFAGAPSRARRLVRSGDVLVSTVRTYLRAVLPITHCLSDVVASTGFAVVRPRDVDPRFLSWAVQSDSFVDEVVARSVGVSYPAVNPSDIAGIRIHVPSDRVQRRIADYLDVEVAKIDELIDAKQEMVRLLDERVDALIGRHIAESALVAGDEARTVVPTGRWLTKHRRPTTGDPLTITAFRDGQVTSREARRPDGYTDAWTDNSSQQGVEVGDIVIHGLDGFAGAIGVSEVSGACSPVYHVCQPTAGDAHFLARLLRLLAITGYLSLFATSTRERAVDFRNWDRFRHIPIPDIPVERQREIGDMVRSIQPLRVASDEFVALLREWRRSLITAVVTGEMEVP